MDICLMHDLAAERTSRWSQEGFQHEVIDGPQTDKPATWLVLDLKGALGQLTVWVSGEAEMDWGTPERGGQQHYDLSSEADLYAAVDDLERQLRALAP